ncbi:MAG: outer membrane lipoprotein-sorting protein [Deltaproteobacteria bacterium]|nr:outer membrane lipoprotein-sorting protein [Deltaproteobacteria bacterium]
MSRLLALAALLLAAVSFPAAAQPSADALVARLRTVDERQRNSGDFQARVYLEQNEKGKADLVYEAEVYRRDDSDKLVILFTRPQAEAGKGYLRIDANLFVYDPTVGRWERRTERERIGGTSSNRADFDESRLADEYAPAFVGNEMLGRFPVERLRLTARPGVDVAYPVVELWLDQATGNLLKRQDFALSGRLLRTTYYPQWIKVFSPSKQSDVYYPKEIRIFDEVEKGTNTTIVFQEVKLDPLQDSLFTKAWLEAKSR